MPSQAVIPQTFDPGDPDKLKRQLEQQAQEIDRTFRQAVLNQGQIPVRSDTNPTALVFGQVTRVSAKDGETVVLKLPRPNFLNIGKRCTVRRGSTTGEVLIYAVDCLVAGAERYRMANDIHFVEFLFDGDYYPSRAGGGS